MKTADAVSEKSAGISFMGRKTKTPQVKAQDFHSERVDEMEWCTLDNVPRRFKFPFPVKVVGWIVISKGVYSGFSPVNGTEFCVRLSSSDSVAVDRVGDRLFKTPFPHVITKRHGEVNERRYAGWREAFFIVYPLGLQDALRRAGVDDGPGALPVWPIGDASDVRESIREIRALFPRVAEPGVADELDARCWALVTRLVTLRDKANAVAARDGADSSGAQHPDERLRAFSASLVSRCLSPIDFTAEARKLGYSRSAFYQRFTALVGEPPERHLANLRLDAAARLLRESQFSIKQIAFAVRDKTPSHFAAAFRARFGVTPRAWRNGAGKN